MKAKYIFFEGDLQLLKEGSEYNEDSAKFNAQKLYIDWVLKNPKLNSKETMYFSLGDFFENSIPSPEENELAIQYLSSGKWCQKVLLGGNHDYNRIKNSHSIQHLSKLPNTTMILKPKSFQIEELQVLCLPYYYDNIYSDLKSMKEEYEIMTGDFDLVITHIQDETQSFGDNKSIDISKIKGQRIQGHLHAVKDNESGYVNSPIACTKGEVVGTRYCFLYDIENRKLEKIKIPNFLNYEVITYPEPLPLKDNEYITLYTIKDYTDKQTAIDFYRKDNSKLYIKEMIKKKLQVVSESYESQAKKSIQDFFEEYSSENKLTEELKTIILEKLVI